MIAARYEQVAVPGSLDCRNRPLDHLETALSSDRHGAITAVIVDAHYGDLARAVAERCWHEAAIIAVPAECALSRAA